jgi:hypothetical protein
MFWSPVVKDSKGQLLYNQVNHLSEVGKNIRTAYGVELDFVVNERFLSCLAELRKYAGSATADLQCPVMRFLQIEEYLGRHVAKAQASSSAA